MILCDLLIKRPIDRPYAVAIEGLVSLGFLQILAILSIAGQPVHQPLSGCARVCFVY